MSIAAVGVLLATPGVAFADTDRPNILLVVADDLGYTDIGAFGSEIQTPVIDELAEEGVMLTNFRAGPTCGPTRAMLMSGIDNHVAGVGVNSGALQRLPFLVGRPGYEGYMNKQVVSFVELLNDSGYRTYMTGKWALGAKDGHFPEDRGFDRSFAIVHGGASHFEDGRGLQSFLDPAVYREDGQPVEELPPGYFSSANLTDKLIEHIESDRDSDQPFFAYLAFTAPHWPLQATEDWIDRYAGRYDAGWDELRAERFQRLISMDLIPEDAPYPDRNSDVPAWDSLRPTAKRVEARRMELYASMVANLDHNLGRMIDYLKQTDQYRNTLILFISDNGAEGNDIGSLLDNAWWIPANFDNRLENMGRPGSYIFIGNGWSQVSVTPGRMYKSFVTEGGMRTPAVISGGAFDLDKGRSQAFATVMDIAPTLLEAAGIEHPGSQYKGQEIEPMHGTSMLPHLKGDALGIHDTDEEIGFEIYGGRAIFMGDWKLVWVWPPYGPGDWELFNIVDDPGESRDLSDDYPEIRARLAEGWDEYARRNNVHIFDRDIGYGRYR